MVWASISMKGKNDLYIVQNGTLTTEWYINVTFDVHVRPYDGAIGPDFILMEGQCPSIQDVCHQQVPPDNVYRESWMTSNVPDLNQIEHAWDMLHTAIFARPFQSTTVSISNWLFWASGLESYKKESNMGMRCSNYCPYQVPTAILLQNFVNSFSFWNKVDVKWTYFQIHANVLITFQPYTCNE